MIQVNTAGVTAKNYLPTLLAAFLSMRPVLKHGPRSFNVLRVTRNHSAEQNESDLVSFIHALCFHITVEQNVKDPKDGELCSGKVKPGETLVEAWRDTDVQIVRKTRV